MRALLVASVAVVVGLASTAYADPISPGGTVTYTVPGTSSIYQIFGHPGSGVTDYGPPTDAFQTTFAAGAGNVFQITASGLVSCCSDAANIPPDGGGFVMDISGINGLSGLTGNTDVPLVGVFTTNTDPFGGVAPGTLTFDANNPTNLSPLLNQVFYIGDGRSGLNNGSGALLNFTAPSTATQLYLGVIDAYGFNGTTGYYSDNKGSFSVQATLLGRAVPEPSSWAMMIIGFGAIGLSFGPLRKRSTQLAC